MISISNRDRDKIVEFLQAYATGLQEKEVRSIAEINARRLAILIAKKLSRKQTLTTKPKTK